MAQRARTWTIRHETGLVLTVEAPCIETVARAVYVEVCRTAQASGARPDPTAQVVVYAGERRGTITSHGVTSTFTVDDGSPEGSKIDGGPVLHGCGAR